jgi:hypothetical protein
MAQPVVIDLYPSEIEPDGTCVYRPPLQALVGQITSGAVRLLTEYPRETLQVLVLALVAGACVWFSEWK